MAKALKTILCIDDDPDILTIAEIGLQVLGGYRVVTHLGSPGALEAAAALQPELILLDVMMPEIDGPGVLKLLRENPATAHIPVVFLTARVEQGQLDEYLIFGAAGVIAKPFNIPELPGEVRSIWASLHAGEPALR
jgi:CheY-like chemotaxis protein